MIEIEFTEAEATKEAFAEGVRAIAETCSRIRCLGCPAAKMCIRVFGGDPLKDPKKEPRNWPKRKDYKELVG